eukprot:scaffold27036_cov63-Phaeocystis_antarctica.AAC.3
MEGMPKSEAILVKALMNENRTPEPMMDVMPTATLRDSAAAAVTFVRRDMAPCTDDALLGNTGHVAGEKSLFFAERAVQITLGQALAEAGMCCKAFAICVREAATIVADRHGWCLLEIGSSPMRHLSKLELDTKLALSFLRDQATCWWTRWRIQLVDLWTDEVDARFIGALFIDPQVLRQHTAELDRYLIKLAMDV